jgi:hypothetical protein
MLIRFKLLNFNRLLSSLFVLLVDTSLSWSDFLLATHRAKYTEHTFFSHLWKRHHTIIPFSKLSFIDVFILYSSRICCWYTEEMQRFSIFWWSNNCSQSQWEIYNTSDCKATRLNSSIFRWDFSWHDDKCQFLEYLLHRFQ